MQYLMAIPQSATTLGSIADRIEAEMAKGGYSEHAYLSAPDGFALVMRLERINKNGSPRTADRFDVDASLTPNSILSLGDYFRALFTADPGYYRVVVLVVTTRTITETDDALKPVDADVWLHNGGMTLPPDLKTKPVTAAAAYNCVALIYEFQKQRTGLPKLLLPSPVQGVDHLKRTGIWTALAH